MRSLRNVGSSTLGGRAVISAVLYAEIQEVTVDEAYTVTFNANGGTFEGGASATTQKVVANNSSTVSNPTGHALAYQQKRIIQYHFRLLIFLSRIPAALPGTLCKASPAR